MTELDVLLHGVTSEVAASVRAQHAHRFNIRRQIGKGSNGYVFEAINRITGQPVILKYYYWGGHQEQHFEPATLATIEHPRILRVLDAETIGTEWALFVTPFHQYGDIDDLLQVDPLGLLEAEDICAGILDGLTELHSRRLLHRDIKPGNIVIDEARQPVIADFGSIRGLATGADEVTASGHSALYRPPEAWGTNRYSVRGDVYQTGLVLYQLAGGAMDYTGLAYLTRRERQRYDALTDPCERSQLVDSALQRRSGKGHLIDLGSVQPWVPKSLRGLIKRACSPDPTRRPATAADFRRELHTARQRSLDWRIESGIALVHLKDRTLRMSPSPRTGVYETFKQKGSGWRRDATLPPLPLPDLMQEINRKFGA